MNWLLTSFAAHGTLWALGAFYMFSNAIAALPSPGSGSSTFYRWSFDFLHLIAGNIAKIVATRYPGAVITSAADATAK